MGMFFTPGRLPEALVVVLMFLMGASASISVLMTTTQKRNDSKVTAIATSAVNTMVTISGAVGQQGYGFLLKNLYADWKVTSNSTMVNRTGLLYISGDLLCRWTHLYFWFELPKKI